MQLALWSHSAASMVALLACTTARRRGISRPLHCTRSSKFERRIGPATENQSLCSAHCTTWRGKARVHALQPSRGVPNISVRKCISVCISTLSSPSSDIQLTSSTMLSQPWCLVWWSMLVLQVARPADPEWQCMLIEDFATVEIPKLPRAVLTSKAFDECSPSRMR